MLAWLLGALALFAWLQAWLVVRETHRVSAVEPASAVAALPHQLVRPEFTADAHVWIRLAEETASSEAGRGRATRIDNAPEGREVHWNSAYVWWLRLGGEVRRAVTGEPLSRAIEAWALWANLPWFLAALVALAWWTARRQGVFAAVLVAVGLFGHRFFFAGFWPGNADHHGLIGAALVGMGLGAFWMRGGVIAAGRADETAAGLRAARWSGVWGGVGLWLSAASTVPALVAVAVAGALAAAGSARRGNGDREFAPEMWRSWGRWGAVTSGVFYLLEYAPSHVGWRLEVNHPVYALAWWGGAEVIAATLRVAFGRETALARRAWWRTALWAMPLVAAPAVVVAVAGARVFRPLDPFLGGVHGMILEFLPIGTQWRIEGLAGTYELLVVVPVFVCAGGAALLRRGEDRAGIVFALTLLVLTWGLACWQARWTLGTLPGQLALLLAMLGHATPGGAPWRTARVTVLVLGLALAGPDLVSRTLGMRAAPAAEGRARQLGLREAAAAIRRDAPAAEVVVWSAPNTAHDVAFYGGFRTLGTLYWENVAGLKAAAAIAAADEEEAVERLRRAGVTHVVLSPDDEVLLDLARLLRPAQTDEERQRSFGRRLLQEGAVPWWLEPVPVAGTELRVYRVRLAEGFSAEMKAQLERRLASAGAEERYRLLTQAGAAAQMAGQRGVAADYLRRALNERVTDLEAAVRLAWILSTAPERDLQQPDFALRLARQCVRLDADAAEAHHVLAAALAAGGDFAGAVAALERAVELQRARGRQVPEAWEQQRESYRQRRAWIGR